MSFSKLMMDKYSDETWSEKQKQYNDRFSLFKGSREIPLEPLVRKQPNPINDYDEEGGSEDDDPSIRYQWKGKFLYTRGRGGLDPVNPESEEEWAGFEEIQQPVFQENKKTFWIWLFFDLAVSRLLLHSKYLGISLFMVDLIVIPLWIRYVSKYKRTLIENRFRGYAINAVLGLRCSAGPSLYSRRTPSRLVFGSFLFKVACCLVCIIMPSDEEISTCADRSQCAGTITCAILLSLWEVYFICSTFILLSMRKNLTEVAQHGIAYEAETVENSSEIAKELLTEAEQRAEAVRHFSIIKRNKYFLAMVLCVVVSALRGIQNISLSFTENGTWTPKEWHEYIIVITVSIITIVVNLIAFTTLMKQTFATWATYQACYFRMRVLSNFIDDGRMNAPKDVMAWVNVRKYYVEVILPVAYAMTDFWLSFAAISGSYFILSEMTRTFLFIETKQSFELLRIVWFRYSVALFFFFSLIVALKRAEAIVLELGRHQELIDEAVLDRKIELADVDVDLSLESRTLMDSPTYDPIIYLFSQVKQFIKENETPPKIVGVSVTPLLVNTIMGYITSLVGIIVFAVVRTKANISTSSISDI